MLRENGWEGPVDSSSEFELGCIIVCKLKRLKLMMRIVFYRTGKKTKESSIYDSKRTSTRPVPTMTEGVFCPSRREPFHQILSVICQQQREISYTPLIDGVILHFWRHQRVQCSNCTNSSLSVKIFFLRGVFKKKALFHSLLL